MITELISRLGMRCQVNGLEVDFHIMHRPLLNSTRNSVDSLGRNRHQILIKRSSPESIEVSHLHLLKCSLSRKKLYQAKVTRPKGVYFWSRQQIIPSFTKEHQRRPRYLGYTRHLAGNTSN